MSSQRTQHETGGQSEAEERPTILVVDDDRGLADTYAVWFESEWNVRVAYGGEDALDKASPEVDVVVLDRRMPEVPGDQVLRQLRSLEIDCQVVMLTAIEPDLDAVELPFDEYLTKPVTKRELVETVDELLLRSEFDPELQEYAAEAAKAETLAEADLAPDDEVATVAERLADSESVPADVDEQYQELERLSRINALIRGIDQQVLTASTVDEVAHTTCEKLVTDGSYGCAWFGEYTPRVSRVQPRASAGTEAPPEQLPVEEEAALDRAVTEHEAVVTDGASTSVLFSGAEAPLVSAICVPVVYRETMYGVLCLGATDERAFGDTEVEMLEGLGHTVGAAINAVERKKLMVSDQAIELEFETSDRADLFVALSAELDCRLVLDGLVPASDEALLCYTTIENAPAEEVLSFGAGADEVQSVRGLGDSSAAEVFEWDLPGDTIVSALTESGATVQTAVFEQGSGTITAQVARDAEVRPVVDRVLDAFPETELLAQRSVERSIQSSNRFRRSLEERLTEQQQATLEAAYAAGYFEWPRDSTAEDLAESMGIASPTLHQHLRAALRKLLDVYFTETDNERTDRAD